VGDPEAVIRAELAPWEKLLWAGRARPGMLSIRASDCLQALLGPVFLGWLIAAVYSFDEVGWGVGALVGVTVEVLFLCLFIGVAWSDTARRKHTCYGVSNERIISVSSAPRLSRKVKWIYLGYLAEVTMAEGVDGAGWLLLSALSYSDPMLDTGFRSPRSREEFGCLFELAGGVRDVYGIILHARQALRSRAS
jgi:hypothetical protein